MVPELRSNSKIYELSTTYHSDALHVLLLSLPLSSVVT